MEPREDLGLIQLLAAAIEVTAKLAWSPLRKSAGRGLSGSNGLVLPAWQANALDYIAASQRFTRVGVEGCPFENTNVAVIVLLLLRSNPCSPLDKCLST